jgi:hypothetical protein
MWEKGFFRPVGEGKLNVEFQFVRRKFNGNNGSAQ